nr:LTA synthase family protein [uncultured Acetatifactor sp.]
MDYLQKKPIWVVLRAIAGFFGGKLKSLGITRQRFPSCVALVICPVITFYLFDFYTHNPLKDMDFKTQLLNIVFYELTAFLLFGLVKYVRAALMLQSGFFMLVGLINYYVLNFRSAPIMPWDILSLGTAASVAGNYDYSLERETILVLACFVILMAAESRFSMKAPGHLLKRGAFIVVPVILLWGYTGMIQSDSFVSSFGLYDKLFTPTVMNRRDGNIVAFLMEMEYMNVEKPDNYSAKETQNSYLANQPEETGAALADPDRLNRPNIIVIMDEAFSDLSVLGKLDTSEDYMPFIHSLQEGADNTVTGWLNVSVLGGNTANTEFEFLTGSTMAFLPQGSVAYQQYVNQETPSLASYLKELGYSTVAVHPYYADGWERDAVYPLLGFDRFLSRNDFSGAKKLRSYISDEADFEKIIELYEEKEAGEPLFVFNVTMQNHGGYEKTESFSSYITAEGISSSALEMYLSLIKETDNAFKDLVSYFSNVEEDTMIVFFGDHQPAAYVSNPILRSNGVDPDALTEEENLLRYKVPYVIWSNFDIEEQSGQETSVNYLSIDVLENCGLPLPSFQNFLKGIREEYPVITSVQVRDREGNYTTVQERGEELNAYRSLQYYLLFDYDSGR